MVTSADRFNRAFPQFAQGKNDDATVLHWSLPRAAYQSRSDVSAGHPLPCFVFPIPLSHEIPYIGPAEDIVGG